MFELVPTHVSLNPLLRQRDAKCKPSQVWATKNSRGSDG